MIARGQWDEEREEQVEHRGLLGQLSYSEWYCNVDTHHCTLIKALRMCCKKKKKKKSCRPVLFVIFSTVYLQHTWN